MGGVENTLPSATRIASWRGSAGVVDPSILAVAAGWCGRSRPMSYERWHRRPWLVSRPSTAQPACPPTDISPASRAPPAVTPVELPLAPPSVVAPHVVAAQRDDVSSSLCDDLASPPERRPAIVASKVRFWRTSRGGPVVAHQNDRRDGRGGGSEARGSVGTGNGDVLGARHTTVRLYLGGGRTGVRSARTTYQTGRGDSHA